MQVAVLGAGSWGTALAILLARNGAQVGLFGRDEEEVAFMQSHRENLKYLPGFALPAEISVGTLQNAGSANMTVIAVPSSSVRDLLTNLKGEHPLLVLASKGLESATGKVVSQVAAECRPDSLLAGISGPNLAMEIVRGIPTAALVASADPVAADRVRSAFISPTYRVYITDDLMGLEIAGALKNVIAIAAGMSDGLGFGDNTKGALLARGLKEMIVYGLSLGGKMETFLGIAGVGDLFATACSKLSRNYRVGFGLGRGESLHDIMQEIGQVAEGVNTVEAVVTTARQNQIHVPLCEMIESVVRGRLTAKAAVVQLMERRTVDEGLNFSKQ
jgi:glycerol-3-phosphate dehydrogenase (NAD(P)+)